MQIVPTPLGMQIDYRRVYRTVEDVDYQRQLLSSLLVSDTVAVQPTIIAVKVEPQTVSLKALPKSFWRHL
ncbi:hypothetical protein FNW02_34600 [Komarekiella sp. 'clone 1']|uniref:Uncharacterized protein n=1 Tax=Komarekiella delphini-convector SJRDD-AB1 TaxID=2593771 RepID=A0AA40T507_9NOST|nr:hypothetical protein [Komarekiella delphini-convector]MBD6620755.1 hypothetical protein [Komarekiella delphini-convector SJRDD-AB1]